MLTQNYIERFWKNVKKGKTAEDCWSWLGTKHSNGIPYLGSYGGEKSFHKTAKLVSYIIHHGKEPEISGTNYKMKCGNEPCVNPLHVGVFRGENDYGIITRALAEKAAQVDKISDAFAIIFPNEIYDPRRSCTRLLNVMNAYKIVPNYGKSNAYRVAGERLGSLVFIEPVSDRKANDGSILWKLQCDCGKFTIREPAKVFRIKNENALHCGCRYFSHTIEYDLFIGARTRARNANVQGVNMPFTITVEDIVVPTHCPVLGMFMERGIGKGGVQQNSPTLDKIIPSKGYVKENIRVISYRANVIKHNASLEELRLVYEYALNETSR